MNTKKAAVAASVTIFLLAACGGSTQVGDSEVVAGGAAQEIDRQPTGCPTSSETPNPDHPDAGYRAAYSDWLRSKKVANTNPKELPLVDEERDTFSGPKSFEKAVDESVMVVSGTVEELVFLPEGTLTRLKVDRTAKGEKKQRILVMQSSYLRPKGSAMPKSDGSTPAELVYDATDSKPLFKGDRAVLSLLKLDKPGRPFQREFLGNSLECEPVYYPQLGSGTYILKDGKAEVQKEQGSDPQPYHELEGSSEKDLMDQAEARAGAKN